MNALDMIIGSQPHATHADCGFFELRDLVGVKSQKITVLALQDDVLVFCHDFDIEQLVILAELGGGYSALCHVKLPAAHDLAHALSRDKEQAVQIQLRLAGNIDDLLRAGVEIADIVDGQPLVPEFAERNIGCLDRVELSGVGEQADPSCIAALHDILEIRVRCLLPSQAAVLPLSR